MSDEPRAKGKAPCGDQVRRGLGPAEVGGETDGGTTADAGAMADRPPEPAGEDAGAGAKLRRLSLKYFFFTFTRLD